MGLTTPTVFVMVGLELPTRPGVLLTSGSTAGGNDFYFPEAVSDH